MPELDLAYRIVAIVFPVFGIVTLGYWYARHFRFSDMVASNRINIDIFTPALIFDVMSRSDYAISDYNLLLLAGAAVVLGSGLVAWPIGKLCGFQWKTFVPPMMFNNSGNMGLPLIVLSFGENALPAAIILFATENFLHFLLGQQFITQHWSIIRVLKNPMIVATLMGVAVSVSGFVIPDPIRLPVTMLGQIAIPLLLFSLGVRMLAVDFRDWKIGLAGALVSPLSGLLIAAIFLTFIPLQGEQAAILLLFSALPPAVLNFLVAEKFNQQPQQVASIVLLGNLGSVVFIPLVLWFIL